MQTARMVGARALVACSVLGLLVSACTDDGGPEAQSSTSAPSSSAEASTTTTSPSTTTSSARVGCEAPISSPPLVDSSSAAGDFDGDGADDTLTVYDAGGARIRIDTADHRQIDTPIADAATNGAGQPPKALGGADITASAGLPPDGSGAEAFVSVGSGASVQLVGVYQLLGCTLTRITGPEGTGPSTFPIGGSVTHLDGLRCDGTAGGVRLVHLSAESADGVTYTTTEDRLEVQNGQFVVTNSVPDTIDSSDPRLQAFSVIDCPGVSNV